MTDLMSDLYHFVLHRRMGGCWDDPDYADFTRCARAQEAMLRTRLDARSIDILDALLGELANVHAVEQECLFRAALSLYRELHGILHTPDHSSL